MLLNFSLLRQLSAQQFRSGTSLGAQLAMSRASVHNAIDLAAQAGLGVQRIPGRGYRLAWPVEWLDTGMLQARLQPLGFAVQVHDNLVSTNALLLQQARRGEAGARVAHKTLLAAEWQSAGRGRRGRQWRAPPGGALLFSLLWRFERPISALSGLSLVVGLALVQGLRALGVHEAQVKWPNDILWQGCKLAGLLIELDGDMHSPGSAVIGVGLNIRLPESTRAAIDQPVADLVEAIGRFDRNVILVTLAERLAVVLQTFAAEGFAPFRAEWEAVHAHQDRPVCIHPGMPDSAAPVQEGIARGVDLSGALLVDTANGRMAVHAGEVSVRGAANL